MRTTEQRTCRKQCETGSSLVELMIAMLILATGLCAVTTLLVTALASNGRNRRDTTATLLAQMVIEQISAQPLVGGSISVQDCAGNSWTIASIAGAVGTGNGAKLKSDGTIDFTQSYASITTGYAMQYVDCSDQGGLQTAYEVRWNVMSVSTNTTVRMITAAARPGSSNVSQFGGLYFAIPVYLRGLGPTAGG